MGPLGTQGPLWVEASLAQGPNLQLILDFQMVDAEGNDFTDAILASDTPVLLHISKDLDAMSTSWQHDFNALGAASQAQGWDMYGLTNATAEEHLAFVEKEEATYPFLTCDQTELKIVVRANPGLVWIQQGVVMEKWSGRDVPTAQELAARGVDVRHVDGHALLQVALERHARQLRGGVVACARRLQHPLFVPQRRRQLQRARPVLLEPFHKGGQRAKGALRQGVLRRQHLRRRVVLQLQAGQDLGAGGSFISRIQRGPQLVASTRTRIHG